MTVRRALLLLGWPVGAWLVVQGVLAAVAAADHLDPWAASTWIRFDSYLYLGIARDGYALVPCDGSSGFAADQWCGNTGWFPLYPALIRLAIWARLPAEAAALGWTSLFEIATLAVLWNGFLRDDPHPGKAARLLLAAAFPGAIYRHAAFPISAALLLGLLVLLYLPRAPVRAGLAAFLLPFAHSAVAPLAAAWGVGAWVTHVVDPWRERLRRAFLLGAAGLLGYGGVQLVLRLATGRWDAYVRVAEKYGLGLHNPFATAWWWLHISFSGLARTHPAVAVQIVFVLVLVATLLVRSVRAWRAGSDERALRATVSTWVLLLWPLPFVLGNGVSVFRADALLLPAVLGLGGLPRRVLVVLVTVSLAIAAWLGDAFFRSEIV